MHTLWYDEPAEKFFFGLPIGTGRLAAMIFGATDAERLALNHEWLWRGQHTTREPDKSAHLLPEVRALLLAGKYEEGTVRGNQAFAGGGGLIRKEKPARIDAYQPAGDLYFTVEHGEVSNYRRELNIADAVAMVSYAADGVTFTREYIAHLTHDLLLLRLTSSAPSAVTLWLDRAEDQACFLHHQTEADLLAMDGQFERGMGFRVEAHVLCHNGTAAVHDNRLEIHAATEIVLAVNIGTSVGDAPIHECRGSVVPAADWAALKASHVAAYHKQFQALTLTVDDLASPPISTGERLSRMCDGEADPSLPLLCFNYGRYLHIAATATASLPPNLYGG